MTLEFSLAGHRRTARNFRCTEVSHSATEPATSAYAAEAAATATAEAAARIAWSSKKNKNEEQTLKMRTEHV